MPSKLAISLMAGAAITLLQTAHLAWAQGQAALTGIVTSDAEGAMEGVVVSAHKAGSIVTVSVTTDAQGRYSFPENRLEPGQYSITIRAVGYDEKSQTLEVELANGQVYQYVKVYPEVYRRFMAAPNPTSFYDDKIAEEYTGRRV